MFPLALHHGLQDRRVIGSQIDEDMSNSRLLQCKSVCGLSKSRCARLYRTSQRASKKANDAVYPLHLSARVIALALVLAMARHLHRENWIAQAALDPDEKEGRKPEQAKVNDNPIAMARRT